ncbi:MAG: hypothetical protein MJ232_08395, partial [archaeon]|nr:hypothetical protein [archaeon]
QFQLWYPSNNPYPSLNANFKLAPDFTVLVAIPFTKLVSIYFAFEPILYLATSKSFLYLLIVLDVGYNTHDLKLLTFAFLSEVNNNDEFL